MFLKYEITINKLFCVCVCGGGGGWGYIYIHIHEAFLLKCINK